MFPWQLLLVCLLANVRGQSLKTPLYVGSMAPLTGKRAWWGAGITAAMQMAFEYINNRSDILPFYELRLLANDTQGATGLGNKILYDYIAAGIPSLVLGPGRSNVALSVADTAKYWKMIQTDPELQNEDIMISGSAESGDLSDSTVYPYFFRTISSISASKSAFVALAKAFHWTRISILFFSRDMYIKAAIDLKKECERNNITVLSYGSYIERNDADNQLEHIKNLDARIIFAFLQKTTSVMCSIYKHKLYGKKYGWVVHTPDSKGWWNRTYSYLDCTSDQVNEAAEYAIIIDHLYLSKMNVSTISGLTPPQFHTEYKAYVRRRNLTASLYGPFGFDAAWIAAIALNVSTFGDTANRKLLDINEDSATEEIKSGLLKTKFWGVTGEVQLENNGDRTGNFEVFQLRGSDFDLIALHDATKPDNLTYYNQKNFDWRDGRPPRDHIRYEDKLIKLSQGHFIVMCVFSSLGILLCLGFLYFNVVKRNKRCIKMSSPNINSAMIIGCVLAYASVILFAIDGQHLNDNICKARVAVLDIGFTIAFGSMFSKTWRVHRITRKLRVKRRVIRDIHLFGMIFVFLLVDAVILIVWFLVDPLKKGKKYLKDQEEELDGEIVYKSMIYYCATNRPFVWLLLVYGFKGILLLFGLFLAWETRKVKIATLNDSRYIGMAVYNVFIVCVVGVPLALFSDSQQHEIYFYVIASCILFCTTLTLCLVFIPKIRSLKKSNNEEAQDRFTVNDTKHATRDFNCHNSLDNKALKKEIKRLQERLQELEKERSQGDSSVWQSKPKPSCFL